MFKKSQPVTFDKIILFSFGANFFGTALDAFNLGPMPVTWIASFIPIVTLFILLGKGCEHHPPELKYMYLYLYWLIIVTGVNSTFGDYSANMPPLATVPYPIFIALRLLTIASFVATLYQVHWLLMRGHQEKVVKLAVSIGMFIAIVSIYVYFAQRVGLPDLPRTRMGTGGGEQATNFTYAFHRAQGTFREPSMLGVWLLVPFFLSLVKARTVMNLRSVVIGLTLLLTGSLTAIVGLFFSLLGSMLINRSINLKKLKGAVVVVVFCLCCYAAFSVVHMDYEDQEEKASLAKVVSDRLKPILQGELLETNRGYVILYMLRTDLPVFGQGIGNANIAFSEWQDSSLMCSFNNDYLDTLYAGGVPGMILFGVFLLTPLRRAYRMKTEDRTVGLLAGLQAGYMIMSMAHPGVSTITFAIGYAFLAYHSRSMRQGQEVMLGEPVLST